MRIDNAQFTGSATGTTATATLSGSFSGSHEGSGLRLTQVTASKLLFSASFGLGIVNNFDFDGSTNQTVTLDTASAHFIAGVESASIDNAETGSFIVSMSAASSSIGELLLEKGDGTFISQSITATQVVNQLNGGLGVDAFSYNGSTAQTVNIATGSARFIAGVSALTGSFVTAISIDASSGLTASKGDGTQTLLTILSASRAHTASNADTASFFAGAIAPGSTIDGSTITNTTASSIQATGSFQGDLEGTASVASKVAFALSQSDGILAFSYDGSARAAVGLDTASGVFITAINNQVSSSLTGSSILNNTSATGSFQGDLDGTASFASKVENTLDQGLGIENFSYDGDTAGVIVQLDTSSAHYLTTIGNYTQSLATSITASINAATSSLSASLTVTDQAISSSVAALSASASTSRNALSSSASTARDAISSSISNFVATEFVSESVYAAQTGSFVTSATTQSGREEDTLEFTKGDGTTFDVTLTTSSFVKSVNTVTPNAAGNVAISLASVETGTSASMLAFSSSGNFQDGDVWVISGQSGSDPSAGSASNGVTFIYASSSGQLLEIASLTEIAADTKYVDVAGDTMTGQLVLPAANPTLANEATRKGYVDTFYNAESIDDASSQITLTKGDGTSDIISLAGISVSSSVSASNVGVADGRRITATTNPTQNFITLNDGASNAEIGSANNLELNINTDGGAIGQIDFQNNGTSVANIDQDGTGSFAWVDSTASYANRTRHSLTTASANAGIIGFEFDGNTPQTIALDTGSAIFVTAVQNNISSSLTGSTTINNGDISGSFTGSLVGSLEGTASVANKVAFELSQSAGILAFSYDGSARAVVGLDTSSALFRDAVLNNISSSFTSSGQSITGSFQGDVFGNVTGNLTGTASFAGTASGLHFGATIATTGDVTGTATNFDGSGPISIPTTIANDVIDYATLAGEFTNVTTTTAPGATYNIDFTAGAVWNVTANAATTTFTISNQQQGDVKTIIFDGNGQTGIALPASVTLVGGNNAAAISMTAGQANAISILCYDATTPAFVATINNQV